MKLLGSLRELVGAVWRKDSREITLRPNQTTTYTADRDVQLPQTDANVVLTGRTSTDTGANRLQNKDLDDDSVKFVDSGDTSKALEFETSGSATSTTTTIASTSTVSRTVSLPDASTTLVGTDATQTLTNKTLASPLVTTAIILDNQAGLTLREGTGGGTDAATIKAPPTLAASYSLLMPADAGTSGQTLTTAGNGNQMTWTSPLTNPMDSAGDLIVGGAAGAATKLDSGTAETWLVSKGAASPAWTNTVTTGKFVDGSADEIQLRVQGHSTQTNRILSVETSAAAVLLGVSNTQVGIGEAASTTGSALDIKATNGNSNVFTIKRNANSSLLFKVADNTGSGFGYASVYDNTNTEKVILDGQTATVMADKMTNTAGTGATEFTKGFKVPVARYKRTTAQSLSVGNNRFDFATSEYDNYSAVTTGAGAWKFTAPIAGKYLVTYHTLNTGGAPGFNGTSDQVLGSIFKNGSQAGVIGTTVPSVTASRTQSYGSGVVDLAAGDFLYVNINTPVAYSTEADGNTNSITVSYLGV